jgi:hypothetical protein
LARFLAFSWPAVWPADPSLHRCLDPGLACP